MNAPLTEQDIKSMWKEDNNGEYEKILAIRKEKVQSAKRLAKQKVMEATEISFREYGISQLSRELTLAIIDACFQIPDDNQGAAKGGLEEDALNPQDTKLSKPPRKSLFNGDDK